MASAVIDFSCFSQGGFAVFEIFFCGLIQSIRQNNCFWIVVFCPQVLQRNRESQKFAQRILTQMVFFQKLVNVFWGRTSGTRFKQSAAVHQRNNGEHFCACAQFQNREEVRQIIAQHISRNRNVVFFILFVFLGKFCSFLL